MSVTPGTRIGVFEIIEKLGEGGMGEVYRAHDTRLDRRVALKVLPDLFTTDPERLARFEREAKVLASLNHPNIAQVYGFEPPAGPAKRAAIAMELVEGHTLQELLRTHASEGGIAGLPLERTLGIARQISAALEAAHEQGVIHRDLKPANISVREDGTVKVLDFGLAKAFAADAESAQSAVAQSPTLTARSTQLGLILGTAAYMSPEQARGRAVDRRADVWAFGVILFEMLSGHRAFEGDDVSDVLASVLKTDPDWSLLPADLPPPVRRLLRRCLERDPKKRLRDVAEGMLQLDEGLATGSSASMVMAAIDDASGVRARLPFWRRAAPIALTAVGTAVIVAAIGMLRLPPAAPGPAPMRSAFFPSDTAPFVSTQAHRDLAISQDGRVIAYVAAVRGSSPGIYIRRLDQLEGAPLPGAAPAIEPFFSPDGQWVGFVDQTAQEQLRKVPILGGPVALVTTAKSPMAGATWMSDGIVFGTRDGPLSIVGEGGGEPKILAPLDRAAAESGHHWPSAVPGTRVVLFVVAAYASGPNVSRQIAALDRESGRLVRLGLEGSEPRYVASGHIVYSAGDGTLRAVAFDPRRLVISGAPVPVVEGVGVKDTGAANFDISRSGHLVHTTAGTAAAERTITWVDRSGRENPIPAAPRNYFYARVSPDGTKISLDVRDEDEDVWIWDVKRETPSRLTDQPGSDQYGLWTPDQRLIFFSSTPAIRALFRHRPDAIGKPEQLTDTTAEKLVPFPNAITPDGRQVIFRAAVDGPKNDLFIMNIEGDRKIRRLISTEHDERNAALSPDGRFIAFESDVSGRFEVYARPFPDVDATQVKVSTDGGQEPVWSPDGREIFYVADGRLMSVRLTMKGGLEFDKPQALFDVRSYFFGGVGRNYDVSPDGTRFVMVKNPERPQDRSIPIVIVMNWIEELRARVK